MEESILARIGRAAGVGDLVGVLADRLSPADLASLMLAVHRRRAAKVTAARLLDRYRRDRFAAPSPVDPARLAAVDGLAFALLDGLGFAGVALSPVGPLGTVSALTGVDQNNVLATGRGSEVQADVTNTLALECAARRRALLRVDPRDPTVVRLCASHRLLRAQRYDRPELRPHFQLLALTTAGRDTGSFRFETASLVGQLDALLRLLARLPDQGYDLRDVRVGVTDLTGGVRRPALRAHVLTPLRDRHPDVALDFDDERTTGRGYYVDACFRVHATNRAGVTLQIADGGCTTWTRQLLGNAKERLLTAGLGVEQLVGEFTRPG